MDEVIRFLYEDALGGYSLDSMYWELVAPNSIRTDAGERYREFLEKYLIGRTPVYEKRDI